MFWYLVTAGAMTLFVDHRERHYSMKSIQHTWTEAFPGRFLGTLLR